MTRRHLLSLPAFAMFQSPRTVTVPTTNQLQNGSLRILEPARSTGRVLYILPVNPGISNQWGDGFDTAVSLGIHNKHGFTLVAPTFTNWPWFADHPTNPKIRQETYFVEEVVPAVDKLFPDHKRLLVGFSKSGNGAVTLILRHSELFHAAAAWDAPLMKTAPDQFGMIEIFGTTAAFQEYSVPRLLEVHGKEFAGARPRLAILGYDAFEEHTRKAHEALHRLKIPHYYENDTRRVHRWDTGWLQGACRLLDEMSS